LRFTLDSNILVRAVVSPHGPALRLLDIVLGAHTLVLSRFILEEVGRVLLYPRLQTRYQITANEAARFTGNLADARKAAETLGMLPSDVPIAPDYSMKKGEVEITSHMRDFIDCIRSGQTPRCGIDRAWEEAVTVVMSVEAYFKQRRVKWDPAAEQIV
jgi:predicted nucleic acid-binding protein